VVGLLFLLLPFLLLTTSIQKLTGLDLQLAASAGELAPLPPGQVEAVEVHLRDQQLRLRSAVRTRDVTASQGDVTWSELALPAQQGGMDLAGLQDALARLQNLDPDHQRVLVVPDDAVPTSRVVALVDAVRSRGGQPLYPEVVLGGAELSRHGTAPEPSP
jgi:biopolymer transport protein ExbD